MGLFINQEGQPSVYKNRSTINTPNQNYVKYNVMTELLEEQKRSNMELIKTIQDLNRRHEKHQKKHVVQWNNINSQMIDLKNKNDHLTEYGGQIIERLVALDGKYSFLESLLEKDNQTQQTILEQIQDLKEFDQTLADRLETQEETNLRISNDLHEQVELQKEVSNQLTNQKEFQDEIVKRLDNQEVLTEKMARQLNHIRSILFERTNYLVEKIEEGYKLTSSYVYKLMNGTDQPLTFTFINNKKQEEEKK